MVPKDDEANVNANSAFTRNGTYHGSDNGQEHENSSKKSHFRRDR